MGSMALGEEKGWRPVSSTYMVTPRHQKSAVWLYPRARMVSGATYLYASALAG
jgi:hypothetical protein